MRSSTAARNISAPATASSIAPVGCCSTRSSASQATGDVSFADADIDFTTIRAVSFAYPKGGDWRDIETHVAQALAAE